MKRTQEEIKQLVEAIKQANTAGWVCDSVQACEKWQAWVLKFGKSVGEGFYFCPFCKKQLDWQNWERLKDV